MVALARLLTLLFACILPMLSAAPSASAQNTWVTETAAHHLLASEGFKDPSWTAVTVPSPKPARPLETGALPPRAKLPATIMLKGKHHDLNGIASYYWQGQMTASGEVFDKRAMTAAHKTLPFGTKVKVTNLNNGKSAIVRINDRGPFKPGRVIDVSEAAAEVLSMTTRGLAPVRVDVVR
jgi:rare lipoprotein A (peptidoglycan hydrolase)